MIDPDSQNNPLMTPRTALVLLLAMLSGIGAGLLTLAAGHAPAESVMASCGAAAAGLLLFHQLIARE